MDNLSSLLCLVCVLVVVFTYFKDMKKEMGDIQEAAGALETSPYVGNGVYFFGIRHSNL